MKQETEILRMIGDMKGELGEFRGQLRELIHNMNSISVKLDALASLNARNHDLPDQVSSLNSRVTALEAMEHRRDAALTIGQVILKSPLLGWMAGAAVTLWAIFGR